MILQKTIADFIAGRDFVSASEIAHFLVSKVQEELGVETLGESFARPLIYRGATTYAREALKKPSLVEAVLDEAEQGELYEEFSEMVWIGEDEQGTSLFGRRKSLTRDQYQKALDLLRAKAIQLREKIQGYQDDFDRASPYWSQGMTFGVAISLAVRGHQRMVKVS